MGTAVVTLLDGIKLVVIAAGVAIAGRIIPAVGSFIMTSVEANVTKILKMDIR
jgi:hypothetical protein